MTKMQSIDHVAIAVRSIENHLDTYRALGFRLDALETVPEQNVRVAFLSPPMGETRIELVEPADDDSPISGFLQKYGEKIHHICLRTNDIKNDMEELRTAGFRWITPDPGQGAGGACIAFLHPRSTGGVLIEFKELPSPDPVSTDEKGKY